MSAKMRAKMTIESVTRHECGTENLRLRAVTNGNPEDNTFAKATPGASLDMLVSNPELVGKFDPGETFYVDFTPAD